MCGIIAILNRNKEAASGLYYGLFGLQHRGKESARIVTTDGKVYWHHGGMGEIPFIFRDKLQDLPGHIGIAHNRYSTTGTSDPGNIQPIRGLWKGEEFWIAHNGNLTNTEKLRRQCLKKGRTPYTSSDTGVIATLISLSSAHSFKEAIKEVVIQLEGAFSLVILYKGEIIALKDSFGIRPLCLGRRGKNFVVASESCVLYHMGATFIREVERGEMVTVTNKGFKRYFSFSQKPCKNCIFEPIYFLRPDSIFRGRRVKEIRKNMGKFLAQENPVDVDSAIGVPDSGKYGGLGFIKESGLPNGDDGIFRPHLFSRTFIEPVQELREKGVELKFVIFPEEVEGKRIGLIDDSIVRGTTQKRLVRLLREAGAKEVHARILSPPYQYPCYYGIDTYRIAGELIAARHRGNIDKIRKEIDLETLGYLSLGSVIRAIQETSVIEGFSEESIKANDFCTACFTGKYPVKPP